jgi:hypothetical protein
MRYNSKIAEEYEICKVMEEICLRNHLMYSLQNVQ